MHKCAQARALRASSGNRDPDGKRPAVTHMASLVQLGVDGRSAHHLLALEGGAFDIEVQYQIPVTKKGFL